MHGERIHELIHLCRYYTVAIPVPRMDDNIPGRNVLLPQQVHRPGKNNGLVSQCENRRILAVPIFPQEPFHAGPYAFDAFRNAHPLHRPPLVQASRKLNGSAAPKKTRADFMIHESNDDEDLGKRVFPNCFAGGSLLLIKYLISILTALT